MNTTKNHRILEKHTKPPATLCSFWKNISGPMINLFWVQFVCNHSYGYAHNDILGRIEQTDSLTDFIKHAPIVCIPIKYPG